MARLERSNLPTRVIIDASHANSRKDPRLQPDVASEVGKRLSMGESGIVGVMLESFLEAGRQEPGPLDGLVYGQSITDGCMDMDATAGVLNGLAAAVRKRRDTVPEPDGQEPAGQSHATASA